jgi:hypothetical protein
MTARATDQAATNKLFRAAAVELPAAGRWRVHVAATTSGGTIETQFTMIAGPPLPAWFDEWPWFGWPILAVALFIAHRFLAARQQRQGRAAGA